MRSIVFLSCLFLALSSTAQTEPNIILFIADDISFDDFGCYGNNQVKTPHIDRLAARGLRFTNMYLTASSCSPSRNSIITGRYPHNTGAAELHTEPPLYMIAFPELLKREGYYTGLSGKFHMGAYAERAFDTLITDLEIVGNGGGKAWVELLRTRPREKPFFLWYAAYDAHRPWGSNAFEGTHRAENSIPPKYLAQTPATQADLAKYYDEIARFDHHIGQVVRELEQQNELENTVILVMSDNGRPFPHSKTRVNDRGLKTPFIVHWPKGIPKPGVVKGLVSAIDIAPTLFDLTAIAAPASFQGHSFKTLIRSGQQDFRNYLFGEHNWHDYEAHQRMVRSKRFLYIRNARPQLPLMGPADAISSPAHRDLDSLQGLGQLNAIQGEIFLLPRPVEELYDCEEDPEQYQNLAALPGYASIVSQHRAILEKWMQVTGDDVPEQLTKDWYEKKPNYLKTKFHGQRGEMPGARHHATKNNAKGKF